MLRRSCLACSCARVLPLLHPCLCLDVSPTGVWLGSRARRSCGMPVGCWWDAGRMLAGRDTLAPLASVCCAVKYCCGEWSWHFVSEQPPGSGLLNFSCSPVAPVLPCTAPALCLAGRKQKTRSRLSWGALMPSQPFLHPHRDRGAGRTCPRRGKQRTWHRVG